MDFIPYADPDGNSGIAATAIILDQPGGDHILVLFKDGSYYVYYEQAVGRENFREMIDLARQGDGLNALINLTPEIYRGYS